jgi:prepilin-type processing-associated H-X9-DG protein
MTKQQIAQNAVVGACLLFCLAMVSPTLELSREKIQRAKCASNLKQLGIAWATYLSDYRYEMPAYGGTIQFAWGTGRGWMDRIFPYVSPDAVGKGPSYPESAETQSTEAFRCPSIPCGPDGSKNLCGYILNMRLYFDSLNNGSNMARVTNNHKLVVLYDRNASMGSPDDADMTDEWNNSGGDGYGQGGLWYSRETGFDYPGPHDGGHNILFADWHVKWFGEWDSEQMTRHPEFQAMP